MQAHHASGWAKLPQEEVICLQSGGYLLTVRTVSKSKNMSVLEVLSAPHLTSRKFKVG